MIDLQNKDACHRLMAAIKRSDGEIDHNRLAHRKLVQQFAGSWYSRHVLEEEGGREILVNLMNQAGEIYQVLLAANRPQVLVSTAFEDLAAFAYHFQLSINTLVEKLDLGITMQECVLNAFFSYGIVKIFMGDTNRMVSEGDVNADPGRPFAKCLSVDDWGYDTSVKRLTQCRFMYDFYRVPMSKAQAEPMYDERAKRLLSSTSKYGEVGQERTSDLATGATVDQDEYEPMVDLMDVWLPEQTQVATFQKFEQTLPLVVRDWPLWRGPYRKLSLMDVPDNIPATTPAGQLMPLHLLHNSLYRKLAKQARIQKENPVATPTGAPDAAKLRKAGDGVWVTVRHLDQIGVFKTGGIDQTNLGFSQNVQDQFDRQGGGIQGLAGLAPQADTARQEQMLAGGRSERIDKFRFRVVKFTEEVCSDLAELLWLDRYTRQANRVDYNGLGIGLSADQPWGEGGAAWTPDDREGEFDRYLFRVEPFSMVYQSPSDRMAKLDAVVDRLLQLLPAIQAAGGQFDVQELVEQYAELNDMPRVKRLVTFAQEPLLERPGPDEIRQAPHTTREHVRRNIPTGGTPAARSSALQQATFGGQPQTNGNQLQLLERPGPR